MGKNDFTLPITKGMGFVFVLFSEPVNPKTQK